MTPVQPGGGGPMTAPPAPDRARQIRAAHQLIKDLFAPAPRLYWRELAVTGSAAWLLSALAIGAEGRPVLTAACLVAAALAWYRATILVHELTHQRREEIPGFHRAWNLV